MNKYEGFYQKEIKNNKIAQKKRIIMHTQILLKSKNKNIESDFSVLESGLFNLCKFDESFILWFKENIIGKFDKSEFYLKYLLMINYLSCTKKDSKKSASSISLDTILNSFVKSGLVNNIEPYENGYMMTLPDGEKIPFFKVIESQNVMDNANGHCHAYSEVFIRDHKVPKAQACCGYFNDLYGLQHYHTFVISNDIVYDISNNIKMSLKHYLKLINFQILLLQEEDMIFEEIKYLSDNDPEFEESTKNNFLKVTMYKQMNK